MREKRERKNHRVLCFQSARSRAFFPPPEDVSHLSSSTAAIARVSRPPVVFFIESREVVVVKVCEW